VRGAAIVALLLLSCCSTSREARFTQAKAIAGAGELVPHIWRAGDVEIVGFERRGAEQPMLVVYIEGDGRAWANPWQPSGDPTPTDPIALRLAASDLVRPLLYLARPCQYVGGPHCRARLWTNQRLSAAVVGWFQQIIDDARRAVGSDKIGLIGYSGGGALAALIAEQRHDVVWLITVAANLDLALWARLHDIEPLAGSLDPAFNAKTIEHLPQVHFGGAQDAVVPPKVLHSFLAQLAPRAPARVIILPGFDHDCCWVAAWPRLLEISGLRFSPPSGATTPGRDE
jgi:pimeloyl-ACP methyl ester carboxylesterase